MGATYRSAIGLMEVASPATPNPNTAAPMRHHFFRVIGNSIPKKLRLFIHQ